MPQVSSLNDLPFHELSPEAFQSLVIHLLLNETARFEAVEDVGRTGSDSGIDVFAKLRGGGGNVIVQVKRTLKLSSDVIKAEVEKIHELPPDLKPALYIVATSSTPSAKATFTFKEECARAGIPQFEIWNRTIITAKVLKHPEIIEYFFGSNYFQQFIGLRTNNAQRLQYFCSQAVSRGIVLILGRGTDLAPDYPSYSELDTIVENLLISGRVPLPPELHLSDLPKRFDVLMGKVDQASYEQSRQSLYRQLDTSLPFKKCLSDFLQSNHSAGFSNLAGKTAELIKRKVVRGIVQLLPDSSFETALNLNLPSPIQSYHPAQIIVEAPFMLQAGIDENGLPRLDIEPVGLRQCLDPHLFSDLPQPPIFVAINVSPLDTPFLRRAALALPDNNLLVVAGTGAPPIPGEVMALSAQPLDLLSLLDKYSASTRLLSYCKEITFNRKPSLQRILYSASLQPEDTELAKPPQSLSQWLARLQEERELKIVGYSGSGKSTLAFFIAREMRARGRVSFYLSCSELGQMQIGSEDLIALVSALAVRHPDSLLIIDDYHLIQKTTREFEEWKKKTAHLVRPGIITIETEGYATANIIGGQVVRFLNDMDDREPGSWKSELAELIDWTIRHRAELEPLGVFIDPDDTQRFTAAQNIWHFFYLLRGGKGTLTTEMQKAKQMARANIVWFAICMRYHFMDSKISSINDIAGAVERYGLKPVEISKDNLGPWISECLYWLVENRMIVKAAGLVMPRHSLEAATLIRLCLGGTYTGSVELFQNSILGVIKDVLPPLKFPTQVREALVNGRKYDVYSSIQNYLNPVIAKILHFQFALIVYPTLKDYFDQFWSEFNAILRRADLHHLYWMFNRVYSFSGGSLLFTPWTSLESIASLVDMNTVSDAIDFSYVINGMMEREAVELGEYKYLYLKSLNRMMDAAIEAKDTRTYLIADVGRQIIYKSEESGDHADWFDLSNLRKTIYTSLTGRIPGKEHEQEDAPNEIIIAQAQDATGRLLSLAQKSGVELDGVVTNQEEAGTGLTRQNQDLRTFLAPIVKKQHIVDHLFKSLPTAEFTQSFDYTGISAGMLALAHLWLASPQKAADVYNHMSPEQVSFLENKVINGTSYSDFHFDRDSILFQLFLRWLAERNERVARYYQTLLLADGERKAVDKEITDTMAGLLKNPPEPFALSDMNLE